MSVFFFFFFQEKNGKEVLPEVQPGALPFYFMGVLLREEAMQKLAQEGDQESRRASVREKVRGS